MSRTCFALISAALLAAATLACRDLNVVTAAYATLAEATAEGAVREGFVPEGLPPGTREIRAAHDLDSDRRWGLFNFPVTESDALRKILGENVSLEGHSCNPPRRIEWWPRLLREDLDAAQIAATGHEAFRGKDGGEIFVVNWKQGRAYYWKE